MTAAASFSHRIDASHPSLPGHFPGQALVPGVVLLSEVIKDAESFIGAPIHVQNIAAVKFTHPLLPDSDFQIHLESERAGTIKFRCMQQEVMLANGSFRYELSSTLEKS